MEDNLVTKLLKKTRKSDHIEGRKLGIRELAEFVEDRMVVGNSDEGQVNQFHILDEDWKSELKKLGI